jgi:drug/metabolite transporter (DMT)-like permease
VGNDWLVTALALGAALAYAASSSLKHVSAGRVPDARAPHRRSLARFVRATLAHPLWLGGIACDAVGLGLQAAALHLGALAIVQPLLTTGLLFALVARRVHDHSQVSPVQLLWAVLFCAALGGFVWLAAGGDATREAADRLPAVIAGVIGAVLAAACVEAGRRQKTTGRGAALLGVAVGVIYAGTAALIKAVTDIGVAHPLRVLISWQLYLALAAGAAGLLLSQLAFQAAPLTASLPASASVDPLLSIVIGVAVYDEHIRRGPGAGTVLFALLLVLGVAVVQLAREPDAGPGAEP